MTIAPFNKEPERIQGIVIFFRRIEGYGFIRAEDGREAYVNYKDIANWGGPLKYQDQVEFEIVSNSKGWVARNVIVLSDKTDKASSIALTVDLEKTEERELDGLNKDPEAQRTDNDPDLSEYSREEPPQAAARRIKGIIKKLVHNRGYGFVRTEDGRDIYVNLKKIGTGDQTMRYGDQVEFEIVNTPKGLQARNVVLLSATTERTMPVASSQQLSNQSSYRETERYYQEALAARDQRNFNRARSLFEKAIRNTTNPYVFLSYAATEETARRRDSALRVLQKGIEMLPSEGILYEHYGMRLRRRGDLKRAAEVLEKGLQAAPYFAKQLHWSLAVVLANIDDENSLKKAASHAEQAKKLGMTLETMPNDVRNKLSLVTGPTLGRETWDFLKGAGFDVRVEAFTNNYADLLVTSKLVEYTESYDLQGRLLARCFFNQVQWKDIDDLLRNLRKPPPIYRGFNLNTEIGFLIVDNANQWRDALYRIIEDSREIIIPIDRNVFDQAKGQDAIGILRQVLDQWLSRRDLFHDRFPVSGRQFYGRESELQNLMRNIDDGQHTGIYGLRKVGKTSLMYQLQEKRPQDLVVYIDLQKIAGITADCAYLYWRLGHSLQEVLESKRQLGLRVGDVALKLGSEASYEALDKPEEKNALRFDEDVTQLLKILSISETTASSKIVITIDELEWMLPVPGHSSGFRGYAEFFAHLRGIAQTTKGKLVSVVTAANPAVSEQGKWDSRDNPVFQFYKDMFLPPLAPEECNEMIEKLGRGMGVAFDLASLKYIYSETGGHPYITRQLCSHIVHQNSSRPLHVTERLVAESIDSFIRNKGDIFEEILDRLDYFPQEKDLFFFIAEGLSEETELSGLVNEPIDVALRHLIGYQIVEYKNGHYHIKINLLYRWLRRFRLGYKD